MVTPSEKGGGASYLNAVAPDGETVTFGAVTSFAGISYPGLVSTYLARRAGGREWVTTPLQPPFFKSEVSDVSASFDTALGSHVIGLGEGEFMVHDLGAPDTPEEWERFGDIVLRHNPLSLGMAGVSADLCHLVFNGEGLTPESPPGISQLYDMSSGCDGGSSYLKLVAVKNQEGEAKAMSAECPPLSAGPEDETLFDTVSGDGRVVFFSLNVGHGVKTSCRQGANQVFARLDGVRTLEVSRPLGAGEFGGCGEGGAPGEAPGEVPCPGAAARPGAFFRGASEDGSLVFFTTDGELVPGDGDGKSDLYMARIGCPEAPGECAVSERRITSLTRVSEDPNPGQAADVLGVVNVARSGGSVYFVAHGALTGAPNGEGLTAVDGADNLYAYDTASGRLQFVADLCSDAASSGEAEDVRCPPSLDGSTLNDKALWSPRGAEAQLTDDGRYLVFASYGRLLARGADADTDEGRDVYRFDIESGTLRRVSLGEDGFHANGNGGADASIAVGSYGGQGAATNITSREMVSRAMSEDGSWVVFTTTEPLSSRVSNGLSNVYAWHEGAVSLISSGDSPVSDSEPVIAPDTSPEGRDILFSTTAGLVPADTEGDQDVYDARIGGGFPEQAIGSAPCADDACPEALTSPAPTLVPGSAAQPPEPPWPPPAKKAKAKSRKGAAHRHRRKRHGSRRQIGRGRRAAHGGVK